MKQVWGLGAAVLSLLLVIVFWTVYVTGRLATTERLAPSEMVEGIEVPVIGTVGDFPDPEHRVVVNVTQDGRIVVDGVEYATAAFVAELKRRADQVRGEPLLGLDPPRYLSDLDIVLRVDGRVPWGCGQTLVSICAESGAWRVSFAVRHEDDGSDGAFAVHLPLDRDDPRLIVRRVVIRDRDGEGIRERVRAALAGTPSEPGKRLVITLDAERSVPTGVVVAMADAAVRAGATELGFAGGVSSRPGDEASAWRGALATAHPSRFAYGVAIGPAAPYVSELPPEGTPEADRAFLTATDAAPPMPRVPRVRGAMAGLFRKSLNER